MLARAANSTIRQVLSSYYQFAPHRRISTGADVLPLLPAPKRRPLFFFRGMLHFEPAPPFLGALQQSGFDPAVFRYSDKAERNHLRQWPENVGDVLCHFLNNPALCGENPVFVGHSAGGFICYALASVARGGDYDALRNRFPQTAVFSNREFDRLANALSRGIFVAISSPLNGIRLTRVGAVINKTVVEPRNPILFNSLRTRFVEAHYREIGRRPDEVLDGNVISTTQPRAHLRHPIQAAYDLLLQGGLNAFSPFLDHGKRNDGIVPIECAVLKGPREISVPFDHLKQVETEAAGFAVASLIQGLSLAADPRSNRAHAA